MNIASNGFGQAAGFLIQFISVPVLIHSWGVEQYGEWLLISTIPAYLNMSDIGLTTIAANEMTMLVSGGNRRKALDIFQNTWVLICCISLLVLSAVLSITRLLPVEAWFDLKYITHSDLYLIIILLSLYVVAGLQSRLLLCGFRCEGNYAAGAFINTLSLLVEQMTAAIVIYLGGTPVHAAFSLLAMRCACTVLARISLERMSPWIVYGYQAASIRTIKKLVPPAFAFMAFPFGNILKDQGLITVIAFFLGPSAVVVFSATRTVINAGYQLMAMINNAVWPEISTAYGENNLGRARRLHCSAFKATFLLSLLFTAGIFFTGEWIISKWTLGKVVIDPGFLHLMLAVLMANSLWYASSIIPFAINRHERISIYYLAVTGILLLSSLWLVPVLKLNGAAAALLAIHLFMSYFTVKTALALLNDSFSGFLSSLAVLRLKLT